jgi:hypothetical protein
VRNGGFEFSLRNIFIHARKVILHAVNLRHGTDGGFTSPPKEMVLRIFITLKNPSIDPRIEPANLGSSGEHADHLSTEVDTSSYIPTIISAGCSQTRQSI